MDRRKQLDALCADMTAHDVGDVDRARSRPGGALKSVRIDKGHKELELFLFPVVRSRRQEQEMTRNIGELPAKQKALGVLDFVAPHGRGHLVRFVDDDQVPFGRLELLFNRVVSRELIEPRDA